MDTSKEYIKMCDCPEIQDGWRIASINSPIALLWVDSPSSKHDMVYLPRQDQIQEMIIKEKFGDFGAHWDICVEIPMQFVAKNPTLELSSMEQMWLSCYMLSVHHKAWSSEEGKWVKK